MAILAQKKSGFDPCTKENKSETVTQKNKMREKDKY